MIYMIVHGGKKCRWLLPAETKPVKVLKIIKPAFRNDWYHESLKENVSM